MILDYMARLAPVEQFDRVTDEFLTELVEAYFEVAGREADWLADGAIKDARDGRLRAEMRSHILTGSRIEHRWGCVRSDGSHFWHTKLIIDWMWEEYNADNNYIVAWLDPNDDEPGKGYPPESAVMQRAFAERARAIAAKYGLTETEANS